MNGPITVEPADAGVLLASKWAPRKVVHRLIIDVRHPRLYASRKANTPLDIASEDLALDSPCSVSFAI